VLGDVRVWTQQGLGGRLGGSRKIDQPPRPTVDRAVERHPEDAAGTAAHPYGHPSAVEPGKRSAPPADPTPPGSD
jgi:hypothetical protein